MVPLDITNCRAEELVSRRRLEAVEAAEVIGADAESWNYPDGALEPTLAVRHRIIREVREFQPDLVLTHRPCDYHPDHRAVGQCVQDASYLVRVPHVVPGVPPLRRDPVVAYMPDLFTRPAPLRPDVVLDIGEHLNTIVRMLACHPSQVFEWLPWVEGMADTMPEDETGRMDVLTSWLTRHIRLRADRFRSELIALCGDEAGRAIDLAEIYEISEYAHQPDDEMRKTLFPSAFQTGVGLIFCSSRSQLSMRSL